MFCRLCDVMGGGSELEEEEGGKERGMEGKRALGSCWVSSLLPLLRNPNLALGPLPCCSECPPRSARKATQTESPGWCGRRLTCCRLEKGCELKVKFKV